MSDGQPTDRQSARQRIEEQAIADFALRPQNTGVRRTGKTAGPVHVPEPTREWFVVIPVKGTPDAKSRLAASADLALAIALDTVEAALAAPSVTGVVVVTSETAAESFDDTDAFVVVEPSTGLASAIASGIETADSFGAPGRGIAILLGDLPALRADELDAALDAARSLDHATVPDAEGTGTTLITAGDGQVHSPAFGPGSNAAHRALGYRQLEVSSDSGLRNDVDTPERLAELGPRLGPRTRAVLGITSVA